MKHFPSRGEIHTNFVRLVIAHGDAFAEGNSKGANKLHKELHALYNQVTELEQLEVFINLATSNDENIRLWAAIFTLKIIPEISESVLE